MRFEATYKVEGYACLTIEADSAEEAEEQAKELLNTGFVDLMDYPLCEEYEVTNFVEVDELD